MGKRSLAVLLGTVSVIALGRVDPVLGQETNAPAAAGASGLEEIVVTARRREERAQSVPITLTTVSQAQIETQEIHNVNDLARDIPGFSLCCGTGGNATFSWIRGVTGVIGYFDDAPVDLYGPALYYDLDNVQVLKGPQGTLFGLSTNGGAVVYESKKPSNIFEGFVQAEGGNYGHYQFQGAVNIPVVPDKLMVRVGGEVNETNGYIHDVQQNIDLANEDYYIGRVSVTARPSDDFENTTVVNYVWSSSNYAADDFIPFEVNPNKVFAQIPLPGLGNIPLTLGSGPALSALENPATAGATFFSLLGTLEAGGHPSLSFFPNIAQLYAQQRRIGWYSIVGTSIPGGPYERDQRWNIVNTSTWDVTEDFSFKNVASYQEVLDQIRSSTSLLPINLLNQAEATVPHPGPEVQYTDDLQFTGKLLDGNLSFTLGAFGLLSFPQSFFPGGAYFPGRGLHPIQYNCTLGTCTGETQISHRHTEALYGQATYNLSQLLDGLSFTAGYRYTWDHAYENDAGYTGAGVQTSSVSAEASFHAPSQLYELQYQFAPSSLLYVSYNKGFSTGGFNPGQPTAPISKVYQPEVLKEVEAGIKTDFDLGLIDLDSVKARTNFAAYYGDYLNIKQNVTALGADGALAVFTLNVASAYTEGVEGQFTIQPVEDLTLGVDFSWNHVAFTKFFLPSAIPGGAPVDYRSAPQSYNPYWQYNITANYHFPINRAYGDVSLGAIYNWTGQHSNTIILPQLPQNIDPAFSNLDMNLGWKNVWGYDGVSARLWVTNLLENVWSFGSLAAYQALGIYDRGVAKPRMYGLTLRYDFSDADESPTPSSSYTPPPVQPPASAPAAQSYLVFFDFNKSDLTPQAVLIVDQAARNAAPARVMQLTVTGHTDTVGSDAYNLRLSRRRAESVAAELEKDGIPSSGIEIVAKGKHDLLVPTADGVREPQNRRVQIVYSGGATS